MEEASGSAVTLIPLADDSSRVRAGPAWGLRWRGGWGSVGPVLGITARGVTRAFMPGEGGAPPPGTAVDLSVEIRRSDPLRACRIPFRDVSVPGPLGEEPAWFVPGDSATWAVFVHGKGADRTQALTTLGLYAGRGFPCLVISYRNDPDGPASPDGRYHYGRTEWRDLEAACRWALAHGAERLLLVGDSMGGGIVLALLENSPIAPRVRGAILDATVVDFGSTIDLGVHLARLPWIGTPLPPLSGALGKELATLRYGVDWSAYDLLRHADRIRAPLLLFHGGQDDVAPYEGSVALASLRPDLATLVSFPGARHLESWNLDRARYESAVARFLGRLP